VPEDTAVSGTLSRRRRRQAAALSIVARQRASRPSPTRGDEAFTYRLAATRTAPIIVQDDRRHARSNIATVTITIAATNDAPVAAAGSLTTAEDTAKSGTLSASDADGDALTYSIVANGTKGVAAITNAATGAFTSTPNANAKGADSFTFKARDGSVDSNTATMTVDHAGQRRAGRGQRLADHGGRHRGKRHVLGQRHRRRRADLFDRRQRHEGQRGHHQRGHRCVHLHAGRECERH
jgi:hypothetical protein